MNMLCCPGNPKRVGRDSVSLFFKGSEIGGRGRGLTFDDVLLVPRYSEILSRKNTALKARVTRNHSVDTPILSANMDTVTGGKMIQAMASLGGVGVLHRFMTPQEQIREIEAVRSHMKECGIDLPLAASVGVKEEGRRRASLLVEEGGVDILALDIAHGDSRMLLEALEFVKKTYPQVDVMAGNTATAEGAQRMIDSGADAVKVGIGPGSLCTTRLITGHGVPQLTAISLCAQVTKKASVPLIADGGMRHSGDMVKALCAGANCLMVGGPLAGALETPGKSREGKRNTGAWPPGPPRYPGGESCPWGWPPRGPRGWFPVRGPLPRSSMN